MDRKGKVPGEESSRARARRALQQASAAMREAEAAGRPNAGLPPSRASIATREMPEPAHPLPPRHRRRPPLLEAAEIYVGCPELGATFAYRDTDGKVLADVEVLHTAENHRLEALLSGEPTRHIDERWVVLDDGGPLFYLERYRAAETVSFGVFDPEGRSLSTYVAEVGLTHRDVTLREASSAPVARMRTRHRRHVIMQADGAEIGYCWRAFSAIGNDDEDEVWGLRMERAPDLLDRRALVAAPLVCHLTGFPKRHLDRDGTVGAVLLVTVPPVGLAVLGIERAVDGLYWLRRRLD